MTPEQYRAKWSLPSDYPMVAPNYAAQRSALAKSIGLGQLRQRPVAAPAGSPLRRRRAPARSRLPPSHRRAPTQSTRPRTSRRRRREQSQDQGQEQEREQVAAPPEATAKRKSGRARKATA